MFRQVIMVLVAVVVIWAILGSIAAVGLFRVMDNDVHVATPPRIQARVTVIPAGPSFAVGQGSQDTPPAGGGGESQPDPLPPLDGAPVAADRAAGPIVLPVLPDFALANAAKWRELDAGQLSSAAPPPNRLPKIVLRAGDARLHGKPLCHLGDSGDIVGWTRPSGWIDWPLPSSAMQAQAYYVDLIYSCGPGFGGEFTVTIGDQKARGNAEPTGSWNDFRLERLGVVSVSSDRATVSIKPMPGMKRNLMKLRRIEFIPVDEQANPDAGSADPEGLARTRAESIGAVTLSESLR